MTSLVPYDDSDDDSHASGDEEMDVENNQVLGKRKLQLPSANEVMKKSKELDSNLPKTDSTPSESENVENKRKAEKPKLVTFLPPQLRRPNISVIDHGAWNVDKSLKVKPKDS